MTDHGRFFGEDDPEWAIAQLTAHAAEAERDRRSMPWLVLGGAIVTTGLVVAAFVLGLGYEPPAPEQPDASSPRLSSPITTLAPVALPVPQVTLRPKPKPVVAPPAPEPTYEAVVDVAEPVVEPDQPSTPSNQVGPNRPITTPIDPDDR